jgi:hypothetical protein
MSERKLTQEEMAEFKKAHPPRDITAGVVRMVVDLKTARENYEKLHATIDDALSNAKAAASIDAALEHIRKMIQAHDREISE